MTTATVDYDRLESIYQAALSRRLKRKAQRRKPPLTRLWDGDWNLRGRVSGELDGDAEWKINETGAGLLTLPYDHHLALWAARFWKRKKQNIHITVDKDGARWSGRCNGVTTRQDANGIRTTTLEFLHDYEELKHIPVWSNPFLPAAAQFPKMFMLAGPAIYTLKLALFLNLFRLQGNLWALPDDPLSFKGWTQGLNYKEWPILVKPSSLLLDDSKWTVIMSRFKTWHDMAASTLGNGQLMVECRRWLVGDPQPWPGAGLRRNGQLIIDIVDKSGWFDQTAIGGTIAGGLVRTGLEVADNLIDEGRRVLGKPTDPAAYNLPHFLGVEPQSPWVVYRTNDPVATAESTEFTWQPATVTQITAGGHSMPGVNEGISAAVQLTGSLISQYMMMPDLGGVADTLLKPLYEDVFMAFISVKSPMRSMSLGWSHYYENFVTGADKAYTLSSLLAIRAGFFATRERTSHSLKIGDGAPYLLGERGQGHFFLGDRVGGEIPGAPDGQVVVEQVSSVKLSWAADKPHEWVATVGDPAVADDPVAYGIGQIKEIFASLQTLGVM